MARAATLTVLACAFALAGCGGGGAKAPTTARRSYKVGPWLYFTATCEQAMASATCDCVIAHLEASVPVSHLHEAEAAVRARPSAVPPWLGSAMRACGA
ncbi:MAG TPA: hypothetical protein VHT27_02650 [Solirubrobacteraceae bacterium]|nr:hypothetical protein [Solirubrobacteraceae bacterium]